MTTLLGPSTLHGRALTAREREVVALVCAGLSWCEVGEQLGISARTVENHLLNVRQKLGLEGRGALWRAAMRGVGVDA